MDRRDFFKTVAITGAAMTIQRSEAMEILTQTINKANGDKPDLVAVMGGEPEAMFRRAISELGGMKQFIKPGQKVVVKPNIGWDKVPELAGNTNPKLITEIIKQCFAAGAKDRSQRGHRIRPYLRRLAEVLQKQRYRSGRERSRSQSYAGPPGILLQTR